MTLIIGIVGKPSSGKSTFLNAACLTNAKVSELPFTTIEPNKGVAYVKSKCLCKELKIEDNPKNSICIKGNRFIPIQLLDVAGLVPDAHKGKGLGNKFLNDLSKANMLIHILDITGSLDKTGKRISEGFNDPYEDILFLENEINMWFKEILEREDWNKFLKIFSRQRSKFIDELYKRLSGIKVKKSHIILALKDSNLEGKDPSQWDEDDLLYFSKKLREFSKPILTVANKIDKEIGKNNLEALKSRYKGSLTPCSALAEYYLRTFHEKGIINYIPGSNDFNIINRESLSQNEIEMLDNIKSKLLDEFNGTGVQKALNFAVFNISKQICVYPVSDINNYSDNKNNVLPDAILVEDGTILKDFVREKIHTDLADHFMFGIDAITKKRLGENYKLKHNDVIKIVTSK
ncbi:MAG: YchF-related putative GTPase [Candidatus Heimdallarchaeota archaeon]